MNRLTPSRPALLLLAGLLFGLLLATPAQAQRAFEYKDAAWWSRVEQQHVLLLRERNVETRARALQNVIEFAQFYGDKTSLDDVVPELLSIYETDRDVRFRMMALQALRTIGNDDAMQYLARQVRWQRSYKVRRMTTVALADYAAQRKREEAAAASVEGVVAERAEQP